MKLEWYSKEQLKSMSKNELIRMYTRAVDSVNECYMNYEKVTHCNDCKYMDWFVGGCCTHPKSPWKKTVVDEYDFCSKGEKEE